MNNTECFFFQPTDYTSSATVCKWCGKEKYQHKSEQKQLIIDIMNEDAKDGLYKQQTAVEWLVQEINKINVSTEARIFINKLEKQAKQMEKQRHKKFNDFLQKEIELGISDKATIERIEWYYNTYFINNEQQ